MAAQGRPFDRARGRRPRSARAHDQVLEAAVKLFAARGIDATSMDAIAESSGVSKATIYKHWPDKDALCVEVMAHIHGPDKSLRVLESDDVRADLVAVLNHQPPEKHSETSDAVDASLDGVRGAEPRLRQCLASARDEAAACATLGHPVSRDRREAAATQHQPRPCGDAASRSDVVSARHEAHSQAIAWEHGPASGRRFLEGTRNYSEIT
jgi:AcrR family transcriptional regulator